MVQLRQRGGEEGMSVRFKHHSVFVHVHNVKKVSLVRGALKNFKKNKNVFIPSPLITPQITLGQSVSTLYACHCLRKVFISGE